MIQKLTPDNKVYILEYENKWDILNFQFKYWQYKINQVIGNSDYDSVQEFHRCIKHLEKIIKEKRKLYKGVNI